MTRAGNLLQAHWARRADHEVGRRARPCVEAGSGTIGSARSEKRSRLCLEDMQAQGEIIPHLPRRIVSAVTQPPFRAVALCCARPGRSAAGRPVSAA
jgi:hypothetical protein